MTPTDPARPLGGPARGSDRGDPRPVPGRRVVPGDLGVRGREGLLLGLRRPAHPASGQPDVLRHRRLVAELRPHVPAVRDAVRGRLAGQERQRLRLHDRDPGRSGPAHRGHRVQLALRRPRAARRRLRVDDGRLPRHGPAGLRPRLRRLVAGPPAAGDGAQLRLPRGPPRRRRRRWTWPTWPASSRTRSTSTTATGRSTGCSTSPSCRPRSTCGRSWRGRAARSTSSSSAGSRTPPRTGTGTRSRRSGG